MRTRQESEQETYAQACLMIDHWKSHAERAEHHLQNLLARIHRDGGHYTVEHGIEKAAADADEIVAGIYLELDRLRVLVEKADEEATQTTVHATESLAALNAECNRLRDDAERYQFIRDADRSDDGSIDDVMLYAMESLDEYIDTARAAAALAERGKNP